MKNLKKRTKIAILMRNVFGIIGIIGTIILAGKDDFETFMERFSEINPYAIAFIFIVFAISFICHTRAAILNARYSNLKMVKEMRMELRIDDIA